MKLKIQVPEKLGKFCQNAHQVGRRVTGMVVDYLAATLLISSILFMAARAPEFHDHWIRSKVGSRVYKIRDSVKSGGGTGSAVMAPSGETYILTNDHVCGVSKDGQSVLVTDEEGNSLRRRIIAHDETSDLCLIEGMPGVKGLAVASSAPGRGDAVSVVGHPRLMPLTLSKGELIYSTDVMIALGPISVHDPRSGQDVQVPPEQGGILPENCQMAKHSQIDVDMDAMFFTIKVKFCVMKVNQAYQSNAIILPGNSGSPVVNWWGQVEGVAFASDNESHWGLIVSLADIQDFLKNY